MKRSYILILPLVFVLGTAPLLLGAGPVLAQGTMQPYRSYTLDSTGRPIPIPDPYVLDYVIDGIVLGIGDLATPRDIFIDRDTDHLYIADTGNNRLIELDPQAQVVRILGPDLELKQPGGIFRDPRDGTLWIADTGNLRIIQVTPKGRILKEFGPPQSELLTGIRTSGPSKVFIDKRGYIYFLEGTGAGMIIMDQGNQFRGFLGTNRVPFSLEWLWARYAATTEQREKLLLSRPTAHTDMFLGDDGYVYTAVGGQSSKQIQKLSPVGVNAFVTKSLEQKLYKSTIFGEQRRSWEPPARFVALTVDRAGTVTAVDAASGRIYQYDQDRNLLMAFGGQGRGRVEFGLPAEVEVNSQGRLYVLDTTRSVIYVLRPTRFADLVHRASALQYDGRYSEAAATWQEVLSLAVGYELAHSGVGAAAYHQQQWSEAMHHYALGRDQIGYSLSFREYRQDLIRRNMSWLVGGFLVVMAMASAWPKVARRRRQKRPAGVAVSQREGQQLPAVVGILVHPNETFDALASGRSLWPVLVLVGLAAGARVLSLALIAFHMRATPVVGSVVEWVRLYRPVAASLLPELRWEDANVFVEVLRIVLPWGLWTVANYVVSTLSDGEGTFRAVARTTAYCLVPYILFAVPIALASHVLTGQERGLYETLWSLVYYWVLILLVVQIRTVHDYTMGTTIRVGLIIVFGMAVLSGSIVLVGLLVGEAASFVAEAIYEIIRILY